MVPIFLPIGGSRRHSSIVEGSCRSTEITRILISELGWNTVQEAWFGSGNLVLKRVSNSASFLQFHPGSLPHERDGMSVIELWMPRMWNGVSGDVRAAFMR